MGDDASVLAAAFQGQTGAPAAARVQQTVQQAMANGALYTTENCTGIVGGNTASLVLGLGGSAAIKFAGYTGPAAPFVIAAGGVMMLFGAIFAHHSAKVKQEQQIICAVVQSVNDSLSVIDQGVQQGAITAAGASASLDHLYSDLQQNVQPILKANSSQCNAACYILAEARGVIGKRKELYASIAPPPPPPSAAAPAGTPAAAGSTSISSLVSSAATSTGLPTWAIWGGAAVLAAQLLNL